MVRANHTQTSSSMFFRSKIVNRFLRFGGLFLRRKIMKTKQNKKKINGQKISKSYERQKFVRVVYILSSQRNLTN